jgi:hypothetical protein
MLLDDETAEASGDDCLLEVGGFAKRAGVPPVLA